jgi:Flp pilus assembly protein TadG
MSFLNQALSKRKGTHARSERGAAAVEAALVTPLLILLVFGIVEYGMLFKDSLAVTSSIRSAARIASAEPRVTTYAQDAADQVANSGGALKLTNTQQLWVYKAKANGFPIGDSGNVFAACTACTKFVWNNSTKHFDQSGTSTWLNTAQNACPGDPLHDSVGIYMAINHASITGLIFSTITIKDHVVMDLEPIPTASGCK